MAKTHTLRVVAGADVVEREVGGTERVLWHENGNLRSWKVGDVDYLTIQPSLDQEDMILSLSAAGKGEICRSMAGASIELGKERWPVSELASFELAPIPKPPSPAPEPPSRVWRVVHMDGREEVVELESAMVSGTIAGTPADGYGWNLGSQWGAYLADVASIERVEAEAEQLAAVELEEAVA